MGYHEQAVESCCLRSSKSRLDHLVALLSATKTVDALCVHLFGHFLVALTFFLGSTFVLYGLNAALSLCVFLLLEFFFLCFDKSNFLVSGSTLLIRSQASSGAKGLFVVVPLFAWLGMIVSMSVKRLLVETAYHSSSCQLSEGF